FGSLVFLTKAGNHALGSTAMQAAAAQIACFAAGTRIRTARGEVRVEELREGDVAVTAIDGSEAPVVWIGHRAVDCARHPDPQSVWPVRIKAGAFGRGLPKRALTLSPDHAVYVNEVLVPVKHLINGTTIAQVQVDRVTYYHVELDRHDVVYAEGLPAESYLDVGDRANFANGGAVVQLHIDLAHHWEAGGCAPLVVWGEELEGVKQVVAMADVALAKAATRTVAPIQTGRTA
ncbi:MAG TPA: Hint domain-containing protein, partial [Acetobacteraceae bacterium]